MAEPLISLIMGAYNAEATIERAVRAILDQSLPDFECIAINDGSEDRTDEILDRIALEDRRLKVVHQSNIGLTATLNKGIAMAKGRWIARQDADDFSLPSRFEQQTAYLEKHQDVVLLGGNAIDVYPDGRKGEWGYIPDNRIMARVRLATPFPHSTVMMNAALVKAAGGYDESFITAQDTELWMRLAQKGRIAMLPAALIERHIHNQAISRKRLLRQSYDGFRARWRHNPERRIKVIFFSARSFLIQLLPDKLVAFLKKLA